MHSFEFTRPENTAAAIAVAGQAKTAQQGADIRFIAGGIGEIGLAGIAAAITDAVYHATGVRVRELPVKIEDLLA